jgi:TolA-binding protein
VAAAVLVAVLLSPSEQSAAPAPVAPAPAAAPEPAAVAPPATDPAAAAVPAVTNPATPAPPPPKTASATTSAVPGAAAPGAPPGKTPPKGATPAAAAPATTTPTSPVAPAAPATPDPSAEAATRLDVARAKLNSNLADQGLADLRAIITDYPTSTVAADAAFLTAETLTRLGRIDDAMAAHVEFARRFAGDARVASSQLALGELTLKSRQPNRDEAAREIFGKAATAAPGSPAALRALQAKAGIESRRNLRERNTAINRDVPAELATLRTLADQFPASPQGMQALYRLGREWSDLNQWILAATAFTDLATRYPANPHDAWWELGEIYERRLRDDGRARAAYAQVPSTSKRYQDAQRKLTRR